MIDFVILHDHYTSNIGWCCCVDDVLVDNVLALMTCRRCGDDFGFNVPIVFHEGHLAYHLSCYISEECSRCGIATVNYVRYPSTGYQCADYLACRNRRVDSGQIKHRAVRTSSDHRLTAGSCGAERIRGLQLQ